MTENNSTKGSFQSLELKIGDLFEAVIVPAKYGVQTAVRVNGQRCFIQYQDDQTLSGDRWVLRLEAKSPKSGVYFANLERLIEAGDGIDKLFQLEGYALSSARKAQKQVREAESACLPDSTGLAGALLYIARETSLPRTYRYMLALRILDIYLKVLEKGDDRWIPLYRLVAYTIEEGEARENAFMLLIERQNELGDSEDAKASALANLAQMQEGAGRFAEALETYGKISDSTRTSYIVWRQSHCLAQLGRFEEAYKLIEDFPDNYFGLLEGEWSESRTEILDEPRED